MDVSTFFLHFGQAVAQSVRTYLQTLVDTLTDAKRYPDFLRRSAWHSFRFFLISCILLSPLLGYQFIHRNLREVQRLFDEQLVNLVQTWPQDTTLSWDGKVMQLDPPAPITFSFSESFQVQGLKLPKQLTNIISEERSLAEVKNSPLADSLLVVTPSQLMIQDSAQWTQMSLTEIPWLSQPFSLNLRRQNRVFFGVSRNGVGHPKLPTFPQFSFY